MTAPPKWTQNNHIEDKGQDVKWDLSEKNISFSIS